MGKDSTPSEKGYGAGQQGATADDNPHSTGVIERIIGATIAVGLGTLLDPIDDQDKAAGEWEAGRQAGERDAKENK